MGRGLLHMHRFYNVCCLYVCEVVEKSTHIRKWYTVCIYIYIYNVLCLLHPWKNNSGHAPLPVLYLFQYKLFTHIVFCDLCFPGCSQSLECVLGLGLWHFGPDITFGWFYSDSKLKPLTWLDMTSGPRPCSCIQPRLHIVKNLILTGLANRVTTPYIGIPIWWFRWQC